MDKIVIQGGYQLNGEIAISGAKNSAIKLMAVCLLTSEPVTLTNMPRLRDTRSMGQLLAHMGVDVEEGPGPKMSFHAKELTSTEAPYDLVRKMRATFNVLGPTLAREHKARVSLPGGCAIGARPVDLHLKAMEALGAKIELEDGYVVATAKGGLKGADITFPFISVGTLTNIRHDHLGALWPLIAQSGANVSMDENTVTIERGGGPIHPIDMETQAYPGFPTDLQAQFMALMCLADGVSIIRENIFENRFMHCPELQRMGANITVTGREAIVRGVKQLNGAQVMATDLRASASLIAAGLAAKGETTIGRVYHLDRGFEHIEIKLGQFAPAAEAPSGEIHLVFAGGGEILLNVECIDAVLADVSAPRQTSSVPLHPLDGSDS